MVGRTARGCPSSPSSFFVTSYSVREFTVHDFLIIGVPILSIEFYILSAGFFYSVSKKMMKSRSWHKTHLHSSRYDDEKKVWCDDCTMVAGFSSALWPLTGFYLTGLSVGQLHRNHKVADNQLIAQLEQEIFG